MLHQMNVCMGLYQRFPVQNEYAHFEWEDAALADALATEIIDPQGKGKPRRIIEEYVRTRKRLSGGKPWGVKTPFLLPFIGHLRDVCEEIDELLVLVLTERKFDETIESLRRQMSHLSKFDHGDVSPRVFKIQDVLAEHWDGVSGNAEIFHVGDTLGYPRKVAKRLALLAGIEADYDLATRGIRGRDL
jgi:hypothetical protein